MTGKPIPKAPRHGKDFGWLWKDADGCKDKLLDVRVDVGEERRVSCLVWSAEGGKGEKFGVVLAEATGSCG